MTLLRASRLRILLRARNLTRSEDALVQSLARLSLASSLPVGTFRQIHSSPRRAIQGNEKIQRLKSARSRSKPLRASIGPRLIQGPTIPGLRTVVEALKKSAEPMSTQSLYRLIHEDSIGAEYKFPQPRAQTVVQSKRRNPKLVPEPTFPTHPVRSVRYLKRALLATLEVNGRIGKVHSTRPPTETELLDLEKHQMRVIRRNERKEKAGLAGQGVIPKDIHVWKWELIPSEEGTIPLEERGSIPLRGQDVVWIKNLAEEQLKEAGLMAPTSEESRKASFVADARFKSLKPGDSDEIPNYEDDPHQRSRSFGGEKASPPHKQPAPDAAYGSQLAEHWEKVAMKDVFASSRVGVHPSRSWMIGDGSKVEWRDREREAATAVRRKTLLELAPRSGTADWGVKPTEEAKNVTALAHSEPTSGVSLFGEDEGRKSSKSSRKDLDIPPHRATPWLNPNEPEYRQSRQGINDIPVGLRDPRRRQFGFHYGLPKQKELLRAANARDYDQEEWADQPPQDYSHLNSRRQKAREVQVSETIQSLKDKQRKARQVPTDPALAITPPP